MTPERATMKRHAYMARAGAVLLLVLVVVAGLLWWQAQRIADRVVARQLDTSLAAQKLVEQQHRSDIGTRAELIAGKQAFVGYVTQATGGALTGMEVDRSEEHTSELQSIMPISHAVCCLK